jgi:nucleolar protein 58
LIFSGLILFFSLKLTHFEKFDDTTQALAAATATVEGKISKPLKKLLKRLVDPDVQDKLLVADSALGKAIKVCFFF